MISPDSPEGMVLDDGASRGEGEKECLNSIGFERRREGMFKFNRF
jgi:hypothetical protein